MPERESSTSDAQRGCAADATRAGKALAGATIFPKTIFPETIFSENQGLTKQEFSVESGALLRWNEEGGQSQHTR
jgi:hypothetical protein